MGKIRTLFILFLFSINLSVVAQETIYGTVLDAASHEPIIGATIIVIGADDPIAITDIEGRFVLKNTAAKQIRIKYIGYQSLTATLTQKGVYLLRSEVTHIDEVVVTAQESRSLSSSSIIGKHAMEHLQPSIFADLLELLPGGRSTDPVLNSPNTIHLREATPSSSSDYATSALGTSFLLDGAPISQNANMQSLSGAWETSATSRDFTNQGVDMRTISTDDIEKMEIVRGIPSVEYGDLTSGLVKIERKRGGHDLNARLKTDMSSKLFYLAKAFELQNNLTFNLSADYLDSKADPRNTLENYTRLTLSARLGKEWNTGRDTKALRINFDYGGSFDGEKQDPDLNYGAVDNYKSSYNRFAFLAAFEWKLKRLSWFKSLAATFSTSYEHDLITRTRLVINGKDTPAPLTTEQGESDAKILPYNYEATQSVDGKPFNAFAKINVHIQIPSSVIANTLLIGTQWNVDKNYGHGQEFDLERPAYPGIATRPRKNSAIPASHTLSFYAEEHLKIPLASHTLEFIAGLRTNQLLNLPTNYVMLGKTYLDPRINLGWETKKFTIVTLPTFIRLSTGIGLHTKTPTVQQLYPNPVFLDLIQLNYYHPTPAYRRINLITYIVDPTNEALAPARNLKWEVSADINVRGNRLSLTYFHENMTSGFRSNTVYAPYQFKRYDTSAVDAATLTAPPSLETLPYEWVTELCGHEEYTNGSQTRKKGIEYTLSTERIKKIHTRLTITGAYFKTTYRNSQTVMYRPSTVVDNRQIQYVGIYKDNDGVVNQMMNTNFTFDTDIPNLKLGFSLSAQCLWFTMSQRQPVSNIPDSYMSPDGTIHDWQEGDENDIYLQWLIRKHTASEYVKTRIPFSMNLNFKVTKKILQDRLKIAMFCNKIWDYSPDYEVEGGTIRRHVTPYFGLEMNVRL